MSNKMNIIVFSFLLIKFMYLQVECIQEGDFIHITQTPYFATIVNSVKDSACGAAILSEYWLLTAAHCLKYRFNIPGHELKVRTGTALSFSNGSVHTVDSVVIHDNFSRFYDNSIRDWTVVNDIGLIKLNESIKFNEYQQPIKIRSISPRENDSVVIVGLGYERVEQNPPSLKKTTLKVAATGPPFFPNPPSVFHLQNSTSHLCPGDSGSPGAIDGHLAGVVSMGDDRCKKWETSHENRYPGAFTRVDLFYNWILEQTGIEY